MSKREFYFSDELFQFFHLNDAATWDRDEGEALEGFFQLEPTEALEAGILI